MGIFGFLKRNKNLNGPEAEKTELPPVHEKVEDGAGADIPQPTDIQVKSVDAAQPVAAGTKNGKVIVKVRYNRSFTAKLIQSEDKVKRYYGEIKNEFARYNVKTRTSWRYETFKLGRKLLARVSFRGKTLGLYLALDPKAYADTKYKIDDVSDVAKNADVPLLYKIKNDLRCKYCKDLIAAVTAANGLEAGGALTDDYVSRYPYEEIEPLLERGLIKLLRLTDKSEGSEEGLIEISEEKYEQLTAETNYSEVAASDGGQPQYPEVVESVSVAEAEEAIADEVAETFILESERFSDKTKKDIVNIDTLGKFFDAGERVTVDEIKKRVPSFNRKATYVKVLARGTLGKALDVEADDFSPAAIKMIVLTGGTVSRTKTRN